MRRNRVLLVAAVIAAAIIVITTRLGDEDPPHDNTVITNGIGVSINKNATPSDIQAIADAGFKWVRLDIFWSDVEKTKGVYDFDATNYDEINEALKEHDLKPYYILNYGNNLYEDERSVTTKRGRQAFANYAEAVVKRYGGQGGIWEIWNEPNTKMFWSEQPSETDYARLVKVVAPVIRQSDSDSTIVAPALAGVSEEALAWLRKVVDRGLLDYVDAVSVHPYQRENPETVIGRYQELREVVGKDTPIISGEWGYSTTEVNEKQQAEYLARMFLTNSLSDIPVSVWYDWKNDGQTQSNREHNFGLVSYHSTPKLSYLAMQTLTTQLDGYQYSKRIKTQNPNDFILEFKNGRDKAIVFWTTESSHNVKISQDSGEGSLVSMLGAQRSVKWSDHIDLNIQTGPSYLVIK